MNKTCIICKGEGRYKCPICLVFYCSVGCCKKHRANKCDVIKKEEEDKRDKDEDEDQQVEKKRKIEPEGLIPEEKLELLKGSEEVNRLLTNSHLRNLLTVIDKAEDADEIMQKAMLEPIFVEFADACLKVVDPPSEEDT